MKKCYFLIMMILVLSGYYKVQAQPTLTAVTNNPTVGESYDYNTFSAASVNPGNSGANVTWDLSSLTSTGTGTVTYIDPATTANGSSFPDATLSFSQNNAQLYYAASSSGILDYGYVISIAVIPYTDPEQIMEYPLTYNSTFSDNFTGSYTNIVTYTRTGTIHVTADGYGTLIIPTGTVSDVLRLNVTENYTDVAVVTLTTAVQSYYWYKPGFHYAIAGMTSVTTNGTNVSNTGTYLQSTVGIPELQNYNATSVIFPNPSNGKFRVNTSEVIPGSKLLISNISGKTIKELNISTEKEQMDIDLSGVAKGLYFVRQQCRNGWRTGKLIVE